MDKFYVGNKNIPEYATLKEIIVEGTKKGGDKRQYVFLNKKHQECVRSFNDTWRETCGIGCYFNSKGLKNGAKIAIIGENSFDWVVAYYATTTLRIRKQN